MRTTIFLIVLLFCGLSARSGAAEASLSLGEAYPVVGERIEVTLHGVDSPETAALWVVHRPNSQTAETIRVGNFNAEGQVWWTPKAPGIATLRDRDPAAEGEAASVSVAICFSTNPASGILVMVLAGLLLFGGAGWSLRLALRRSGSNR